MLYIETIEEVPFQSKPVIGLAFNLVSFLVLLILLIFINKGYSQEVDEVKKITEIIKSKIKEDAIEQDSNIIALILKINIDNSTFKDMSPAKLLGSDLFSKSTRFCYMKGFNLRFYVLSSNLYNNDAKLKIYRSGQFEEIPETSNTSKVEFFYEIIDSSSDINISSFDYSLEYYEEFELLFSLDQKKAGCAVSIVTIYPQKILNGQN